MWVLFGINIPKSEIMFQMGFKQTSYLSTINSVSCMFVLVAAISFKQQCNKLALLKTVNKHNA